MNMYTHRAKNSTDSVESPIFNERRADITGGSCRSKIKYSTSVEKIGVVHIIISNKAF